MKKKYTFRLTSKNLLSILLCFITLFPFTMSSFASETAYITQKGKAYHKKDCSSLARSKTILTASISEAKYRRYLACKICNISCNQVSNTSNKQALVASTWKGLCVGISDGDTIKVLNSDKKEIKIRLYGVDTPEYKQAFGTKAKQVTSDLVFQKNISIQTIDIDRYGRQVAVIVLPDGSILQEHLLDRGMAWVYPQYCKKKFCNEWVDKEEKVQNKNYGLWQDNDPVAPWKWRKQRKTLDYKPVKLSEKVNLIS